MNKLFIWQLLLFLILSILSCSSSPTSGSSTSSQEPLSKVAFDSFEDNPIYRERFIGVWTSNDSTSSTSYIREFRNDGTGVTVTYQNNKISFRSDFEYKVNNSQIAIYNIENGYRNRADYNFSGNNTLSLTNWYNRASNSTYNRGGVIPPVVANTTPPQSGSIPIEYTVPSGVKMGMSNTEISRILNRTLVENSPPFNGCNYGFQHLTNDNIFYFLEIDPKKGLIRYVIYLRNANFSRVTSYFSKIKSFSVDNEQIWYLPENSPQNIILIDIEKVSTDVMINYCFENYGGD